MKMNTIIHMKKHTLAICLLVFLYNLPLSGQSYDLAFGVRLGTDIGITSQLRLPPIGENFTLETIVQSSLQREEGMVTLLAEQHYPLITRRINLYAGGGVHAGWGTNQNELIEPYQAPLGITGVVGGEITFGRFNISYDFKPAVNLRGGEKSFYSQTGVSIRYVAFKRFDIFESPRQKRKRKRREAREQRRQERRENGGGNGWQFWRNW